jgi:endonuclease YncB( thermonuclease family)
MSVKRSLALRAVHRLVYATMRLGVLVGILAVGFVTEAAGAREASAVYRIDHVVDGDTIVLRNGQHVRLVQTDTPEVYFGTECYGRAASRTTESLLPVGSQVRLFVEPATDRVDQYGRLLRYVVRVNGALNVNIHLVAIGAAAPLLLQRAQRPIRGSPRGTCEEGEGGKTRALGSLPAHPLQPLRGSPNTSLSGFALSHAPLGDIARQTDGMDTFAAVLLVVLLAVPLLLVGVMFVWAAKRDGEEDRAIQRRLGIRRKTRLGR